MIWKPDVRFVVLVKHAARKLRQRHLPESLRGHEQKIELSCQMANGQMSSFWQTLHQQVHESRQVHGLRHKQATVLTIVFAFLLSGGKGATAPWPPSRET